MNTVTIGDVCELIRGVSYKKDDASNVKSEENAAILRANNIVNGCFEFNELVFVPKSLVKDEQYIKKNEIMITMSSGSKAHVGKVAIASTDMNCAFGAFCGKLIPHRELLSKYLYYLLIGSDFRTHIEQQCKGTNINNIKRDYILGYKIDLPSLEEQERIVTRIEELFSQLDSGVETLKKTQAQLAVYRQAVLKEAFENIDESVDMERIATMIDPQPSHRTPPEVTDGIPYVGIGDIDYGCKKINFESARKVSLDVLKEHRDRYVLHSGDFVMGKIGTIGKPFLVELPQNYALSANVILIQPDADKIRPLFLFWQFSSPLITEQLKNGANATSQPAFGIKKARLLKIRICELERQDRILEYISEKMSVCDSIEQTIDSALQEAEALRQSILKRAFEGGL